MAPARSWRPCWPRRSAWRRWVHPQFRASLCAARTLNATGQPRVTLSPRRGHLRAACQPRFGGKGPEIRPKTILAGLGAAGGRAAAPGTPVSGPHCAVGVFAGTFPFVQPGKGTGSQKTRVFVRQAAGAASQFIGGMAGPPPRSTVRAPLCATRTLKCHGSNPGSLYRCGNRT